MRVQFKESIGGRDFNFGRGEFRDLPGSEAKYYISKGLAVEAPNADDEIAQLKAKIKKLESKKKPEKSEEKRPLEKEVEKRPVK